MNQHPNYILNQINSPKDVKNLTIDDLKKVATEIRQLVVEKDAAIGGHVGPNLGIVETTIAFHYVFDSPKDKVVWDISHQSYPHKMLTGRKEAFLDPDHYRDVTGYSNQDESEHDYFKVGHTSTSIALATGMAKARDMKDENGNIVAVIGDGSMSGGLALEGLNNAAKLKSNLIIIFNDNQMSIDDVNGGMYKMFAELRETNGQSSNNLFKAMGLDYRYVDNGNDLETMISVLEEVKDIDHPIVVHINTLKGEGYQPAIERKREFHWHVPFNVEDDSTKNVATGESYNKLILDELGRQIDDGKPIMAINAAIPGAFDLVPFKEKYPDNYDDVDIAEQYSITYATGLAANGARPVVFHNSTFLQRAYDQLEHDMALNGYPVVMLVKGGHITENSNTHQGIFDIGMISSIPNLEYLAPTNAEELISMLRWALTQTDKSVVIREPITEVRHGEADDDYTEINYRVANQGEKVAILGLGAFYKLGEDVQRKLKEDLNIDATLINPISATTLDVETLNNLKKDHELVVTLEDASMVGGFGEKVDHFYANSEMKVLNFGAQKELTDMVPVEELYDRYHLNPEQIVDDIKRVID